MRGHESGGKSQRDPQEPQRREGCYDLLRESTYT